MNLKGQYSHPAAAELGVLFQGGAHTRPASLFQSGRQLVSEWLAGGARPLWLMVDSSSPVTRAERPRDTWQGVLPQHCHAPVAPVHALTWLTRASGVLVLVGAAAPVHALAWLTRVSCVGPCRVARTTTRCTASWARTLVTDRMWVM